MKGRRKKRGLAVEGDEEIPLSPLIDCVFLLLIFFLVTTMLKRKETLIPIIMPDSSSTLSETANEDVLVIGLAEDGAFLEPAGYDNYGALSYRSGQTLERYLDDLIGQGDAGIFNRTIRFDIARETPFQLTINALDLCKLRGFTNVTVKIRQPYED